MTVKGTDDAEYRFGDALHNAKARNNRTAAANRARERELVYHGDYTREENEAIQDRLRTMCRLRNPEWFA